MIRALTTSDLAAELGRSDGWLRQHWETLCRDDGMPRPISGTGRGTSLAWSAAQIWAWLDRDLPPAQQAAAAAHRAAMAAYYTHRVDADSNREIAHAGNRLDTMFSRETRAS